MKHFSLILIVLVVLLTSCKSKKEVASETQLGNMDVPENTEQLVLLEMPNDSIQRDSFEVHSFSVVGDVLEVFVSYGGGCGEADFEMYYTQRVMNSMPPQTVIYLGFTDSDPCRSIVTKKLTFSLEPFRIMAENGGIWLILGGSDLRQLYKREGPQE